MKAAGITLSVLALLLGAWLGLLEGPEPSWICGDNPNFVAAAFGYRGDDLGCRAVAVRGSIKALLVSGVVLASGVALIISGAEHDRQAQHRVVPPGYGMRSADGAWWWDGRRWQPVPPEHR